MVGESSFLETPCPDKIVGVCIFKYNTAMKKKENLDHRSFSDMLNF